MRFEVYTGFPVKPLEMSLIYKLLTSLQENVWQVLSKWTRKKKGKYKYKVVNPWGECTSLSSKYCSILTKYVFIWLKVSLKWTSQVPSRIISIFSKPLFQNNYWHSKNGSLWHKWAQIDSYYKESFLEENIMKLQRNNSSEMLWPLTLTDFKPIFTYAKTSKMVFTSKMCKKHSWKSDILYKDTGHRPASLLKMSLFHRCFSQILLAKTNYLVSV